MSEQEKREKVIKALECCTQHGSMCGRDCNGHWEWTDDSHTYMRLLGEYRTKCPYGNCETGCVKTLAKDALTMLKAQKPRVMTIQEIKNADFCYLEVNEHDGVTPVLLKHFIDDKYIHVTINGGSVYFFDITCDVEKMVRCWTSRPTDEQREAVKWE